MNELLFFLLGLIIGLLFGTTLICVAFIKSILNYDEPLLPKSKK